MAIRRAVRATELLPDMLTPTMDAMRTVSKDWLEGQQRYFVGLAGKTGGNKAKWNELQDEIWSSRAGALFKAGITATVILAAANLYLVDNSDDLAGWMALAYGILFAGAGLVKVHQEVNAFSEHANQYRRMGIAMAVARRRLDVVLEKGKMAEAENVLLGAGRDALEENGSWLLLHRERPVKVPLGS